MNIRSLSSRTCIPNPTTQKPGQPETSVKFTKPPSLACRSWLTQDSSLGRREDFGSGDWNVGLGVVGSEPVRYQAGDGRAFPKHGVWF